MGLLNEIELAVLNFARDYHRYKNIREDIAFKGIKSHPKFPNQIITKFLEVVEGAALTERKIIDTKLKRCKECEIAGSWTLGCGYSHRGGSSCPASRLYKVASDDRIQAVKKAINE